MVYQVSTITPSMLLLQGLGVYFHQCVCVGSVACRIPQMQRGGKGSGPTSPEVQEGDG